MGRTVDAVSALARLAAVWATDGPINHPFENYYDSAAEGMVRGNRHAIAHLSADGRRRRGVRNSISIGENLVPHSGQKYEHICY
jgi:hypothetical protein